MISGLFMPDWLDFLFIAAGLCLVLIAAISWHPRR